MVHHRARKRTARAYNRPVELIVNGNPRDIPPGATVTTLLESLGLSTSPCAVEVNRELVPKRRHEETPLKHGDRVEIVTLVGGG